MITLLIGLFGIVGVLIRYFIGQLYKPNNLIFNSTLVVNIIGCFIIGLCFHYLKSDSSNKVIISSIMIGLCGGLTTFSSFTLDIYKLVNSNQLSVAFLYLIVSLTSGFLFLYIGHKIVS
jgi:CrcB protein